MHDLLSKIDSAEQLQQMTLAELEQLAGEIRERVVQSVEHSHGPFRLESGRCRTLPGSAQRF